MDNKKEDSGEQWWTKEKDESAKSILFNLLFLLVGLRVFVSFLLSAVGIPEHLSGYSSFNQWFTILYFSIGFVFALFYGITFWGVLKRKKSAVYLGLSLSLLDILTVYAVLGSGILVIGSLIGSVLIFWILLECRDKFHSLDHTDKKILLTVFIVLIVYLLALYITYQLPTSEDIYKATVAEALAQKNPEICEQLQMPVKIFDCYRELNIHLKDPKICKSINLQNSRDACYDELARSLNNVEYCNNISWDYQREICIRIVGGERPR